VRTMRTFAAPLCRIPLPSSKSRFASGGRDSPRRACGRSSPFARDPRGCTHRMPVAGRRSPCGRSRRRGLLGGSRFGPGGLGDALLGEGGRYVFDDADDGAEVHGDSVTGGCDNALNG
jgi:hypothetical protein